MPIFQDAHTQRCAALQLAVQQQLLAEDNPAVMLMDLDMISRTIHHMQHEAGYPPNTLHTVAVKANPVGKLLQHFRDRGFGAEAASLGELAQALHVGFDPQRIVFDSPAKTLQEIRYALSAGVAMNLDNWQELGRVADLLAAEPGLLRPGARLGLRINPQVGAGSIAALSTGGLVSKFGFPLLECRRQLVEAFQTHPWLNMLHLHVGSQGLPTERIVEGVVRVWELLEQVEAACGTGRVTALDIGGGLTVDFDSDVDPPVTRFQEQAALLRQHVPMLFQPGCQVQLLTENGRSLLAKAGCAAARVEYTKSSGGRHIAVTHVGADLFMRACYLPDTWGLRVFVCDAGGAPKGRVCSRGGSSNSGSKCGPSSNNSDHPHQQEGQQQQGHSHHPQAAADAAAAREGPSTEEGVTGLVTQDIAGPLCFQGDRLAVAAALPEVVVGDHVMVVDAGAYTLSMYSRYNSRLSPPVYGFTREDDAAAAGLSRSNQEHGAGPGVATGGALRLVKLRAGDTLQQVLDFWNQM